VKILNRRLRRKRIPNHQLGLGVAQKRTPNHRRSGGAPANQLWPGAFLVWVLAQKRTPAHPLAPGVKSASQKKA